VNAPLEVKLSAGLIALGAVVFVGVALAWNPQGLRFPIGAGILAVAVCVGLMAGLRFVRVVTMTVVGIFAVVHLLIALGEAPWWVRVISGLLCAAYIYVAVLVNTEPARQYLETK
jgi:hypothetical protein